MKRAEQLAWAAVAGLIVLAAMLLTGGIIYRFTGFWAGTMLVTGQAFVAALAAWGLMLARQSAELSDLPGIPGAASDKGEPTSSFRMSFGDDASRTPGKAADSGEVKTLDTGFQRLIVGLSGTLLFILAGISAFLVYQAYRWAALNPDQALPVAGTFAKPVPGLDELGAVIGIGAAILYGILWWTTRVKRDIEGYGEAVASNFTLGIGGMAALGTASALGYLKVSYASELAAGVMAALMALQGLELLVNSMRSYSSIEELDQEAVDLQALPFVPMLQSMWLGGLRILFTQSLGLSAKEQRESGVIARLMPRTILAIIIIAIGVSCIRVVRPGEVAVLERLGYAPFDPATKQLKLEAILYPGMHLTLPWPIDELVTIPTQELQLTKVGTELHAPKEWGKNIDFQFWTFRSAKAETQDSEDEFLTGDPGRQMLETYVEVRWRVANPAQFYSALSHSEFFEKSSESTTVETIYAAIIKQCTSYAVTQTFATHSLDHIMITDRGETENHCKHILQEKLDSLHSGIEVVILTIKDLHPPFWRPDRPDPSAQPIWEQRISRGPASAFEFVVTSRSVKEMVIQRAEAQRVANIEMASGDADAEKSRADAYFLNRIAEAQGDAGRLGAMLQYMPREERNFQIGLLEQQMMYKTMADVFNPVNKIIVDPQVKDLQIFQTTKNGPGPAPVGQ